MKLDKNSIEWALMHVNIMKDTDLFPKPIEIDILLDDFEYSMNIISNIDISNYKWHSSRRFIIPKKELSFRLATQLNPLDSILLSAIIYQYGKLIEYRRIDIEQDKVFSYRFSPNKLGYLYTLDDSWKSYWESCYIKGQKYNYAVYLDISDFYNQIYHHTVENELIQCKFPNEIKTSIMKLLEKLTSKTSRGIPVGPHSTHLLAEMVLIPIDEILNSQYVDFCRYCDDIIIFCDDINEARTIVYEVAEILDSQQRLVLNNKTEIYDSETFLKLCDQMRQDNPINDIEEKMVQVFNKYGFNLYTSSEIIILDEKDYEIFSEDMITSCLDAYLNCEEPDFERIKWLYRRLSQIGVDTAVLYTINNIEKLAPAISEIVNYFTKIGECKITTLDLNEIGDCIFKLLDNEIIKSNIYLKMSLLSLFSSTNSYNNINKLIKLFKDSPEELKREIILAVLKSEANLYSWIFGLREQAVNFSEWTRSAYYIACSKLISENRKFYLKSINTEDELEKLIIRWSRNREKYMNDIEVVAGGID